MKKAVISGDIISSTNLHKADRILMEKHLTHLVGEIGSKFDIFGQITKGDYLEFVLTKPEDSLRIALAIKSFVKTIPIKYKKYDKNLSKVQLFKTHGIRLAIGYGKLSRFDPEQGIIDGEAIYLSGRLINKSSTHNKERVIIKNTLYFISNDKKLNERFEPIMALLDVLISKATSKQSEVLYFKLLQHSEGEIAGKLGIGQPAVNQHSTNVGWNSIETAIEYYSKTIKEQ